MIPDDRCQACGQRVPTRRYRYGCGECWHTWRTGWHLIAHDLLLWWRLDRDGWQVGAFGGHGLKSRIWRALVRVRRAKNVYVCPCCAHDL